MTVPDTLESNAIWWFLRAAELQERTIEAGNFFVSRPAGPRNTLTSEIEVLEKLGYIRNSTKMAKKGRTIATLSWEFTQKGADRVKMGYV